MFIACKIISDEQCMLNVDEVGLTSLRQSIVARSITLCCVCGRFPLRESCRRIFLRWMQSQAPDLLIGIDRTFSNRHKSSWLVGVIRKRARLDSELMRS